jgi:hypothetical protein
MRWRQCGRGRRLQKGPTWVEGVGVRAGDENAGSKVAEAVTPDFPKKTKCKPICMPGSSFMNIVTYK